MHYCHVRRAHVSEGNIVSRGQLIAESGNIQDDDCTSTYPHLHIQIVMTHRDMWILLDPYSPIFPLSSENSGYWGYQKNVLSWHQSAVDANPNTLGYWTKRNDPRYSGPSSQNHNRIDFVSVQCALAPTLAFPLLGSRPPRLPFLPKKVSFNRHLRVRVLAT